MSDSVTTAPSSVHPNNLGSIAAQIFEAIPDPVILLDQHRTVLAANAAARNLTNERLVGRDLILSMRNPTVIELVGQALAGRPTDHTEVTLSAPMQRTFEASVLPLRDVGQVALVLHDLTAVRRAEHMRADFVANVSHELRSPLSTLVGFIETLSNTDDLAPDEKQKFLAIMDSEARRMTRLIDDLLSLSKVEADEHVRPRDQIDIEQVISAITDSLTVRADARQMTTRIVSDADEIEPVIGDRDELTAVFHNLIENALSYGHEGTEVTVFLRPVDRISGVGLRGVRIEVHDRSDGIAPEHLPRLTERFYRVDTGRSRTMGGTGLGLAIVKHIVSKHRGRFTIDSTLGKGSVFAVELPTVGQP